MKEFKYLLQIFNFNHVQRPVFISSITRQIISLIELNEAASSRE